MDNLRPRVVISRCIGLDACRYNGGIISGQLVEELGPWVEWVDTCPEVEIGLGTPRPPVRLVTIGERTHLQQPETGRDVTADMKSFSGRFFERVGEVDGFLLKSASPSCGLSGVKLYGEKGQPTAKRAAGLFGGAVLEAFPQTAIEDEARLTNPHLRHHFLLRIFASARLRAARNINDLLEFHTRYKLQLMVFSPLTVKRLGNLLATQDVRPFEETAAQYKEGFNHALEQPAQRARVVNALQHAFGYVSQDLNAKEREHFLRELERYRMGRAPIEVLLALLSSWIERFDVGYLRAQALFAPFPLELMQTEAARRIPRSLHPSDR